MILFHCIFPLLVLIDFCHGSYVIGSDDSNVQQWPDPIFLADKVKSFIKSTIKGPFQGYCMGQDEIEIKLNELLVRNVPCHEEGAIKRYSFDGQFIDGKLNGTGTLDLDPKSSPEQQRCLMIQTNVFNLPFPDTIEGNFDRGFINGIANLTWKTMRIRMNAHVTYGLMHGTFKAYHEKDNIWMIGKAIRNKIKDHCWLIFEKEDEVWRGQCKAMFEMEVKKYPLHIFSLNMTSLMHGQFVADKLQFQDAFLVSVYKEHQCDLTFDDIVFGLPFEYDLKTRERSITQTSAQELCNEKASSSLTDYFNNIKPAVLDHIPVDHLNAIQFLTDIKPLQLRKSSGVFEAILNINSPSEILFEYIGKFDSSGSFHGPAFLALYPIKTCFKGTCHELDIGTIRGTFQHGILDGLITMTSIDSHQITYMILKDGIIHGIAPTYGIKVLSKIPKKEDYEFSETHQMINSRFKGIGKLVQYVNGHLNRHQAWLGLVGNPIELQGYLFGNLDQSDTFSGNQNAYIYPGGKLALLGKFKNNIMVSAQEANISSMVCQDGLLRLEFQKLNLEQTYHQSIGNFSSVGDSPLLPDPYETMTVFLDKPSYPGVEGHGLFAKRDIKKGEMIAFYNGFQIHGHKENEANIERCRQSLAKDQGLKKVDIDAKCFKYSIHKGSFGGMIDLPPWLDDIQLYNATLAHKVNHRFKPSTNGAFFNLEHPRFGTILGIYAIKDIKAKKEIFLDYGYNPEDVKHLFPWYGEMYYELYVL